MPVLPGITDNPSDLEALVKRVSEAGATYVGACAVRLKPAAKKRYMPFIEQEFPHLAERYRNTYGNSAYAGEKYREGLARFFARLCARYHVRGWSGNDDEEGDESLGAALVPPVQLSLEL
jgi:DNA repair photolyase